MIEKARGEGFRVAVGGKSPDFYSNTPNNPLSVTLIIAEVLQERGLPVEINNDATDISGQPIPDYLAIYISRSNAQAREMAHELFFSPEGSAIRDLTDYKAPTFAGCENWDETTRRRLSALHWHVQAEQKPLASGKFSLEINRMYAAKAREMEHKSRSLLKAHRPFGKRLSLPTREEVKELMKEVCERKFPSQAS